MLRTWAAAMVLMWPCGAQTELYRNVGTGLVPGTEYFVQRSSVSSMAVCSAVCLDDPVCMGFVFSSVAYACTTLKGSLADMLVSATDAQGYSIYWKASDQILGFTRYGAKAYKYFPLEVYIDEARQACEDIDGSLALPLDSQENEWVHLMAPDIETWLPIGDSVTEGTFLKDAGGSVSYTNWAEDEPNDLFSEDCAVVGELGRWNDVSCTLERTYVCEVEQEHCDTGEWDIRCTYV